MVENQVPPAARARQQAALLTIDRGNSTLDCRLSVDGVIRRERLDPARADLLEFLAGVVPTAAAALSVVEGGLGAAATQLAALGVPLWVAGIELRCPLQLAYPEPSTLGVDRWVGAVAARERFGDALVVDCGTALTFNLVTRDGRFVGGAIGAGLTTIARGLVARAPGLPPFDFRAATSTPAVTTQDAIRLGVGRGFVGMVEALADDLTAAADLARATRVVTGGEAEVLIELGARGFVHVPDLVHEGLGWLAGTRASSC